MSLSSSSSSPTGIISYAPRISMSYNDLSGIIGVWSQSCAKMLVVQHDADDEVNTTHCHILMWASGYTTHNQLEKQFKTKIKTDLTRNALWSWVHKKFPVVNMKFIGYMTRAGKIPILFNKGFTEDEIKENESCWVHVAKPEGAHGAPVHKTRNDIQCEIDTRYYAQKRNTGRSPDQDETIQIACQVLRDNMKGINIYHVREYVYCTMYGDPDEDIRKMVTNHINELFKYKQ